MFFTAIKDVACEQLLDLRLIERLFLVVYHESQSLCLSGKILSAVNVALGNRST